MVTTNSLPRRRILTALVAVLLVLSFIPTSNGPALEAVFSSAGFGMVNDTAVKQLEQQREQALKGFLLLSALKVGLAVLRSSEVGLILNVRIGDLAVAVYDYVNFGWKVLLAAVAYFYVAEYLVELAAIVNIWFLWVALSCITAWLLIADFRPSWLRLRAVFAKTAIAASVLALLLYLALPLSFVAAGWVSVHITGEPIEAANGFYKDMSESMPTLLDKDARGAMNTDTTEIPTSAVTVPFPYDGSDPSLAIKESPHEDRDNPGVFDGFAAGEKLGELKEYLQERSRALASTVLRQTAAYLFNIVVFPLLMLMALYFGSKYLIGLAAVR